MSVFSTRNSDGASSIAEGCDTISKAEMDRLSRVARAHNHDKQKLFSEAGQKYSRAHDPKKAGSN